MTSLEPEIVIIYKLKKELHIFELTCPLETNIEKRHIDKQNKYAHFIKDITTFTTTVTAFEVSSRGFINKIKLKHLQALHKICKPGIKLSTFKKTSPVCPFTQAITSGSVEATPYSQCLPTLYKPPSMIK